MAKGTLQWTASAAALAMTCLATPLAANDAPAHDAPTRDVPVDGASEPKLEASAGGTDPSRSAKAQDASHDPSSQEALAATDPPSAPAMDLDLLGASLEDLLVIEATSVAKKRQRVQDSAAAVFVLTQEDIRTSPAATVVDLLRTVPGVEVGNLGNAATAVSIRGFNGRNSNSLLVMIDGRAIYVSTLSGVFWDQLMLPLSDIERIEVVRGPGATLWGANAVNGVINIITKNSADTLGTKVLARASARRQELAVSKGLRASDDLTLRLHGTYQRDELLVDRNGEDLAPHARTGGEIGARLDWQASDRDAITLQADYSGAAFDNTVDLLNLNPLAPGFDRITTDESFEQFSVLGRWTRRASDTLSWRAQAYYSHLERTELGLASYDFEIADLDIGLNWQASQSHDLSFGVGVRWIADSGQSFTPNAVFGQGLKNDTIISGYIQDDISLVPDHLNLSLGAKLEYNDFTGFEFQPSARVFFRPSEKLGLWASASRAVRTPSRFERSAQLTFVELPANSAVNPTPLTGFATLAGNPDLEGEDLTALEMGVRWDFAKRWNLDLAGYYNFYESVVTPTPVAMPPLFAPGLPFPVGFTVISEPQNRASLRTWGAEVSLRGQPAPNWSVRAAASTFDFSKGIDPLTGQMFVPLLDLKTSPGFQASLTNAFEFSPQVQLSTQLRYVGELLQGAVPDYLNGDVRLRYDAGGGLEFSLVGENLLKDRQLEFIQPSYPTPPAFVPRTVSAELRFRF